MVWLSEEQSALYHLILLIFSTFCNADHCLLSMFLKDS